jgi:Zn-dependent M28 family amino/carboxypeptidase
MKILRIFLILVFGISALFTEAQTIQEDIGYLASDELEGREIGTKGEEKAAKYVAKRFKKIGLVPKGEKGFYQTVSVKPRYNAHARVQVDTSQAIQGRNVVGMIDNGAATTVVIGAHFDHLGYGGEGSLAESETPAIHNGADDNASGVAMMLQLAQWLQGKYTNNNYVFIAFSGEEKGLWGSSYYAKNPTIDLANVNYMINMDMVGRLDEEKSLAVYGTGTSPSWMPMLEELAEEQGIKLISKPGGIGPSDHTSFYLQDLPVLHFFTGQHEDYHKPTDDADKINYEGMTLVQAYIEGVISQMDDKGKIEFTKTKDEDARQNPSFKVTLGVIPDYMYDGKGMKIDGVREDKPAMNAGLIAGDVVIQIGDLAIGDMMAYMKALGSFDKGDKAMVKVKRGEETLEFEVTF